MRESWEQMEIFCWMLVGSWCKHQIYPQTSGKGWSYHDPGGQNAQNCIILYGGTNQMQTKEFVDEVLADFGEGDYLILQNEINMLDYIIDQAYEKR